ncbi:hypothetical protein YASMINEVIRUS_537 [Yasminevirus sp. GU-2018]|uniref:Divergent protein kinase n=1 Tax=Yasminevirus sp. GU-2018 TaxID=2420051 RepID=A0A5K0U9B0_9VIRU|nr:hypothetical protein YASMINEVIRUS_537 [Yasminevirus sp. GU-2018]
MTAKRYDNLDFLLNIYNDLIYHKTPENSYRFDPITRKGIQLVDLKKPSTFDHSQVFDGELKYLGAYNNRLHFKRKSKSGYPCHVMFGCYEDANTTNLQKGVLYNTAIMYIASEFVVNEKFKHSILPVMLFDIDRSEIAKHIPNFDQLVKDSGVQCSESTSMYCLITEHFFNMMPLSEFLKMHTDMNETLWKTLFFQVLFSLYKLTERLSQFRHNQLNLDAIMVYVKNVDDSKTLYKVGDTKFFVPNAGFDIKIGDYDYATTADYIPNAVTGRKPYNDYYDVHYFFTYLRLWLNENSINVPKSVMSFINDIAPPELLDKNIKEVSNFTGLDESTDIKNLNSVKTIPSMILKKNNFFGSFITNSEQDRDMDMSATPIENPTALVGEFSTDSEFSESEYVRSVTDSDSGNPRLLGRLVSGTKKSEHQKNHLSKHTNNKSSNKNLEISNNTMPKRTDKSQASIREKSKTQSDSENGYTESDILENADRFYRSREKSRKNVDSTHSVDAFEGAIKDKVSKGKNKEDETGKEYESYFNSLRAVARPKATNDDNSSKKQTKTQKKTVRDVPELSSEETPESSDSEKNNKKLFKKPTSKKTEVDTVSISSNSSSESNETGTTTYKKFMEALDKINMADIAAKLSPDEPEDSSKKSKKSKKHRKHEQEHDTSSQEGGNSEDDVPVNKHAKSGKGRAGYESYLGNDLANKIKNLPDNYLAEVPPHMLHMLPDENGVVLGDGSGQMDQQKPNAMAGLLGFGGEAGMGGMPGMGGMEPPQGIHSNRSAPGFGSMGKPMMGNMPGPMSGPMSAPMSAPMHGAMPSMPQVDPAMSMQGMPMGLPAGMPVDPSMGMQGMQGMQGMPMGMPMGMQSMPMGAGMMQGMDPSMGMGGMPMAPMQGMPGDMSGMGGFPMMGGAKPKKYRIVKGDGSKDGSKSYTGKRDFFF